MNEPHILIVEDEKKIAHLLRDYLAESGFQTTCLERGDTVVSFVKKETPALILLDILLPGMSGTDICREIRKFSSIPIIMLTARAEEMDVIVGLGAGADDYVAKPFRLAELVARNAAHSNVYVIEKEIGGSQV